VLEVLPSPDNIARAQAAPTARDVNPYKGSAYGYLGFNLTAPGDSARPHPLFADRDVRRALEMAIDRHGLVKNVFGDHAKVPRGRCPSCGGMGPGDPELPYDTAQAARAPRRTRLDRLGCGRYPGPRRDQVLFPPARAHHQRGASPVRPPPPGTAAADRRRGADRRGGVQRLPSARPGRRVRRPHSDVEHRPRTVVGDDADVDGRAASATRTSCATPTRSSTAWVEQASSSFDRTEARRVWRAAVETAESGRAGGLPVRAGRTSPRFTGASPG